jgi:CubicO group peptidase (beta-lactamase class C family)
MAQRKPKQRRPFIWISLCLVLFLMGCAAAADEDPAVTQTVRTNRPADSPADIDVTEFVTFVEERVTQDHIPGVAVAVVHGSEPLLLQGFGWRDVAQKQPVTPDTLFHIGSTHKSFNALLVATLVDDGLVTWDTPARDIAPTSFWRMRMPPDP